MPTESQLAPEKKTQPFRIDEWVGRKSEKGEEGKYGLVASLGSEVQVQPLVGQSTLRVRDRT